MSQKNLIVKTPWHACQSETMGWEIPYTMEFVPVLKRSVPVTTLLCRENPSGFISLVTGIIFMAVSEVPAFRGFFFFVLPASLSGFG